MKTGAAEQRVEADEAEHNGASQLNSVFGDYSVAGMPPAGVLAFGKVRLWLR
jgi:hypothetical protein